MEKTTIGVVGVGGRTGTMFAYELSKATDVFGIARDKGVDLVRKKNLFIDNGQEKKAFEEEIIKDTDFSKHSCPDILFVATKNPVFPVLKFYLSFYKEKIPTIIISQNGIAAIKDAKVAVEEVLKDRAQKAKIIRISLFNPIDQHASGGKTIIKYSLPIRGAMAKAWGTGETTEVRNLFQEAGFEFDYLPPSRAQDMAFSKLFLNLIGMASASRGLSIQEGFKSKKVFTEELGALKEYIRAVHKSGGRFINFSHYPVGNFAFLIDKAPLFLLLPLRDILAKIISKGREGKPKVLDEIDYYNGGVVSLGEETGIKTPINQKITQREKKKRSLS